MLRLERYLLQHVIVVLVGQLADQRGEGDLGEEVLVIGEDGGGKHGHFNESII